MSEFIKVNVIHGVAGLIDVRIAVDAIEAYFPDVAHPDTQTRIESKYEGGWIVENSIAEIDKMLDDAL